MLEARNRGDCRRNSNGACKTNVSGILLTWQRFEPKQVYTSRLNINISASNQKINCPSFRKVQAAIMSVWVETLDRHTYTLFCMNLLCISHIRSLAYTSTCAQNPTALGPTLAILLFHTASVSLISPTPIPSVHEKYRAMCILVYLTHTFVVCKSKHCCPTGFCA